MLQRVILLFAAALLSACGSLDFKSLKPGKFSGSVIVLWIDGGLSENEGDGKFVYIPTPGDELVFERPDGLRLQPGVIYTDGASIPRVFQVFKGFNPWGYAPAYVVHDWLFVAKRCLKHKSTRPEEQIVAKLDFEDSAEIMGEAMLALKAQQKITDKDFASAPLISAAVSGPISRERWDLRNACDKDRLNPHDDKRVKEYLARFGPRIRTFGTDDVPEQRGVRAIARIGF